jgi:hypothetical protein
MLLLAVRCNEEVSTACCMLSDQFSRERSRHALVLFTLALLIVVAWHYSFSGIVMKLSSALVVYVFLLASRTSTHLMRGLKLNFL